MQTAKGLDWLVKNDSKVRKLCERLQVFHNADDTYGYAIDAIIEKFDIWASKYDAVRCASFDAWILISIGYALRTLARASNNPKIILQPLTDQIEAGALYTNGEECDCELITSLSKLSQYDRFLIVARHVQKVNFTDIADQLGVSKGTIRAHYLKAIERARNA